MTLSEARQIQADIITRLPATPDHPARRICKITMREIMAHGLRSVDHLPFAYEAAFRKAAAIARATRAL